MHITWVIYHSSYYKMQVMYVWSLIYYNQFAICQCNIVDFYTKSQRIELVWVLSLKHEVFASLDEVVSVSRY